VSAKEGVVLRWWVAFAVSSILVVFGHLLMKAGLLSLAAHGPSPNLSEKLLRYFLQPWLVEGLLLYALGSLFWMAAVAQRDVSFLYPLTSVNYLLVVAGSMLIFHEVITTRRWLGVLFIAGGVLLLNRSEGRRE
jgi:drug/metabolite transporter (DMT)-like permease